MDGNAQSFAAIFAFIAFSIPIVGALWKLFSMREMLQASIMENRHKLELLQKSNEALLDTQEHYLNSIQERLQHVRDRSLHIEEDLNRRLTDCEKFLEKTTAFTTRNRP